MSFNDFLKQARAVGSLKDLSIEDIRQAGWKGIVLDFDGVLSSFTKPEPDKSTMEWVQQLLQAGLLIAIHSNNNKRLEELRQTWIRRHYPDILWMPSKPNKPNPSTLIHLKQRWKLAGNELVMVDDRLATGGKAAYRAGCDFLYIDQPIIDRGYAPFAEFWLGLVRVAERVLYSCPQNMCAREDSNL